MGEVDPIALQKAMQESTYGFDFAKMTDEERIEFVKWNVLALTDELHEALAEVGWKPWATSRHINEVALRGELIDAYHFLMNLFIVAGMDKQMVEAMYMAKRRKNIARQTAGYDGVLTKCGWCKKALDDEATTCRRPTDAVSGGTLLAYCGTNHAEYEVTQAPK